MNPEIQSFQFTKQTLFIMVQIYLNILKMNSEEKEPNWK